MNKCKCKCTLNSLSFLSQPLMPPINSLCFMFQFGHGGFQLHQLHHVLLLLQLHSVLLLHQLHHYFCSTCSSISSTLVISISISSAWWSLALSILALSTSHWFISACSTLVVSCIFWFAMVVRTSEVVFSPVCSALLV